MLNQDIDKLTKNIKDRRLEQRKTTKALEVIKKKESELLTIQEAKSATLTAGDRCVYPFVIGDIIRITNHLYDKFGTMGSVTRKATKLVTIRNSGSGKEYTRAWWNLRLIESATPPSPSLK